MEPVLKHRLIGAAVLSALAIIFLPMLIVGKDPNSSMSKVPLKAPAAPAGDFETRDLPLLASPPAVPAGGVVGMSAKPPAAPATSATADAGNTAAVPTDAASIATPASPPADAPAASAASTAGKAPPAASPAAAPAGAAAEPAALEPPPIPAASAGGRYVVSLGTYANAGNAQALVNSLRAQKIPAYAETVTMAGKSARRVRIGPFQQRGDAEAARLKAQQIRSDMPATVVALDAASPAPEVAVPPAPTLSSARVDAPAAATPHAAPAVASGKSSPAPAATTAGGMPAKPAPAAAGRGYAVQVGAYGAEAQASAMRDRLRAAGFIAYSEKVQTESGTRWRLRIGPVADRESVARLQGELKAKLKLDGIPVSYP